MQKVYARFESSHTRSPFRSRIQVTLSHCPEPCSKPATPPKPRERAQDIAKRLASWDWDGGERTDDRAEREREPADTTLEIKTPHDGSPRFEGPDDANQSLGTVWRGFLAETYESSSPSPLRARPLSPTATSPELPPIPDLAGLGLEGEEYGVEQEISFLSLAGDSSLAVSTSTSHLNLLATFPSPSGGDISFTDPFRFASHLSGSSSSSPPTQFDPSRIRRLHAFDLETAQSPSRGSSFAHPSVTTLAERRSRPVPSLRIDPFARERTLARQPSHAQSIVSESVYSRYDDEDDRFERDGLDSTSDRHRPAIEQSYFSPISPEQAFSLASLHPSPLPPAPVETQRGARPRPVEHVTTADDAANVSALSASSSSSSSSSASSSGSSGHLPGSSRGSSVGRHSLLFEPPAVAPPSSTFDHVEQFEAATTDEDKRGRRVDDLVKAEQVGQGRVGDESTESNKKAARVSGWRQDWGFNFLETNSPERDGSQHQGEEDETEEEDMSEGELEKRISLHGQRELERRALERKERWKEERNLLYGEPVDAEYEFGVAL